MAFLQTTNGREILIDDEDFDVLSNYRWYFETGEKWRYPRTAKNGRWVTVHRMILGITDKEVKIDHINHNPLDNRRINLRICTDSQNQGNRLPNSKTVSKYKGVYPLNGKWAAKVKRKHLGTFETQEEAALVYNEAAKVQFGDFAYLNALGELR
jgi:hypothetical protein